MTSRFPTTRLADLACDISYGYTASASVEPVGPKFLRITDIVPERLDWTTVPYCPISERDLANHRLKTGDIVIARTGATVGYSKYIDNPPDAVYASYLVRVRIAREYDSRFVGHVVDSPEYKQFILTNAGGAAQPNANAKILTSYPVPLPPLTTQRRIASILSAYDDLIESNTRRIQILEEMAQAIYREWFVEFQFPGHEGMRMVTREARPIPADWRLVQLGQVLEKHIGGGWGSSESDEKHTKVARVIRGTDLERMNHLDLSTVPIRFHEPLNLEKRTLMPGDVVIEVSGGSADQPVGRVGYILPEVLNASDAPMMCASFCKLLRAGHEFSDRLLYWHLRYLYDSRQIEEYQVQSTGISNLRFRQLSESHLVALPPPPLQERFDEIVMPMMLLVANLGLTNICLRQTRDLLLPRLISGEIDVSDLNIEDAEPAA